MNDENARRDDTMQSWAKLAQALTTELAGLTKAIYVLRAEIKAVREEYEHGKGDGSDTDQGARRKDRGA